MKNLLHFDNTDICNISIQNKDTRIVFLHVYDEINATIYQTGRGLPKGSNHILMYGNSVAVSSSKDVCIKIKDIPNKFVVDVNDKENEYIPILLPSSLDLVIQSIKSIQRKEYKGIAEKYVEIVFNKYKDNSVFVTVWLLLCMRELKLDFIKLAYNANNIYKLNVTKQNAIKKMGKLYELVYSNLYKVTGMKGNCDEHIESVHRQPIIKCHILDDVGPRDTQKPIVLDTQERYEIDYDPVNICNQEIVEAIKYNRNAKLLAFDTDSNPPFVIKTGNDPEILSNYFTLLGKTFTNDTNNVNINISDVDDNYVTISSSRHVQKFPYRNILLLPSCLDIILERRTTRSIKRFSLIKNYIVSRYNIFNDRFMICTLWLLLCAREMVIPLDDFDDLIQYPRKRIKISFKAKNAQKYMTSIYQLIIDELKDYSCKPSIPQFIKCIDEKILYMCGNDRPYNLGTLPSDIMIRIFLMANKYSICRQYYELMRHHRQEVRKRDISKWEIYMALKADENKLRSDRSIFGVTQQGTFQNGPKFYPQTILHKDFKCVGTKNIEIYSARKDVLFLWNDLEGVLFCKDYCDLLLDIHSLLNIIVRRGDVDKESCVMIIKRYIRMMRKIHENNMALIGAWMKCCLYKFGIKTNKVLSIDFNKVDMSSDINVNKYINVLDTAIIYATLNLIEHETIRNIFDYVRLHESYYDSFDRTLVCLENNKNIYSQHGINMTRLCSGCSSGITPYTVTDVRNICQYFGLDGTDYSFTILAKRIVKHCENK